MVNAKSAHEVLLGIVALIVFVMVAVLLAGMNDKAADAILWLFLAFLILQMMFKGDIFQKFLSAHPFVKGDVSGVQDATNPNFAPPGSAIIS